MDNEDKQRNDNTTKLLLELRNENKTLKSQITKLSKRVESLELMIFQDQIDRLVEKITELSNKLLETNRRLAKREISELSERLEGVVKDTSPSFKSMMHDFLIEESSIALTEVDSTSDPLSVSDKFWELCNKHFKENEPDFKKK